MSLERRLAILNISQARVPVPPPRVKKTQKRMASLPNKLSFSSTKAPELYGEKAHSFDSDTRDFYSGTNIDQYRYSSQIPENQSYSKYEVPRKDNAKEYSKHRTYTPPMCDIIESSQRTSSKPMLRRPDILRGSLSADLQAMLAETESKSIKRKDSKRYSKQTKENGLTPQKGGSLDDNKNLIYRAKKPSTSTDKQQVNNNSCDSNTSKTKVGQISPRKHHPMTSTPNTKDSTGTNRFMFYRPKMDKLQRQHNIIELGGTNENMGRQSISLTPSPEGSFVNPAFEIVDMPKSEPPVRTQTIKSVATTSRPVYSTMGSAFSTRPCTPSPPSHRFRNSKPPLPPVEPTISPIKPPGPTPLKPMLSAKQLEQSLKQYSSQSRLDTTDMCSPQALENMMKYYKISSNDSHSAPPPTKLSASKKNQSPYSSSGSLNVSGDSIDVVLRRKKKVSHKKKCNVVIEGPEFQSSTESLVVKTLLLPMRA